jgi:hypothetical protein
MDQVAAIDERAVEISREEFHQSSLL